MAGMSMAGFLRNGGNATPVDKYMEDYTMNEVKPEEQGHGRVYTPDTLMMLQQSFRDSNPIMSELGGFQDAPRALPRPAQSPTGFQPPPGFVEFLRGQGY
jgi:hypothetical protein